MKHVTINNVFIVTIWMTSIFQMNSFDHMDSDDSPPHGETYYTWGPPEDYSHPPGSVNSDYGETPSDLSSPMSQ